MNGKKTTIRAVKDMMLAELVLKYLTIAGINKERLRFIYNSREIQIDSLRSLEELRIIQGSRIDIILESEIIETHKSISQNIYKILFLNYLVYKLI